jgi:hypothetical protein
MLAGTRALVVFADNCADDSAELSPYPSLNRIAAQGVAGWLSVRRPEMGGGLPGVALAEVLGVMPDCISSAAGNLSQVEGFEKGRSGRMSLKDRYGGLGIRILSNQPAVCGLETSLGADCKLLDECLDDQSKSPHQVAESIVGEVLRTSSELVIVHLDARHDSSSAQSTGNQKENQEKVS